MHHSLLMKNYTIQPCNTDVMKVANEKFKSYCECVVNGKRS